MNSFPFVRHHFLRAGFEVVDCPPLTAQLKNSADIKMVMDVLDFLKHQTYFDEFVLLSGDADFTPVLHRLRAHARRTVVYANDHTATPYTAISDGEVREADLINLLMEGRIASGQAQPAGLIEADQPTAASLSSLPTRSWLTSPVPCRRPASRFPWKRWPIVPCARWGMNAQLAQTGRAPAPSAIFCLAGCRATCA